MSTTTFSGGRQAPAPTLVKPSNDLRLRLINLLLLTTLAGTAWSVVSTSSATTAFRSRLPAKTLTRLVNSQTAFPVPSLPFFADKRNYLNQLFVKKSWGWVTALFLVLSLALFLFHPHHPSTARPGPSSRTPGPAPTTIHLLSSLRRFLLASLFWFYLTQATWFGRSLGPSIAFRILKGSGATCVPSAVSSDPLGSVAASGSHNVGVSPGEAAVCTGARGEYWRGGHDVSGHAFMMVHAALFLFEVVYPILPSLFPFLFKAPYDPSASSTATAEGPHKNDDVNVEAIVDNARVAKAEKRRNGEGVQRPTGPIHPAVALVGYAATAVLVLCWWMLLMTSLFFHSPAEKLTGVAFGLVGWYVSGL